MTQILRPFLTRANTRYYLNPINNVIMIHDQETKQITVAQSPAEFFYHRLWAYLVEDFTFTPLASEYKRNLNDQIRRLILSEQT